MRIRNPITLWDIVWDNLASGGVPGGVLNRWGWGFWLLGRGETDSRKLLWAMEEGAEAPSEGHAR